MNSQNPNHPLGRQSRAAFLSRAGAGVIGLILAPKVSSGAEPSGNANAAPRSQRKGQPGSKVKRWDVITIGNLSRNRYWGESDAKAVRSAICTCTVIQGDGFRLLVDPSLTSAEEMARELDRRTGLKPADITAVFVTHEHGDHHAGLAHFPSPRWFAGPEVASILNSGGKFPKNLESVTGKLFDALEVMPTPGHTMSHASLRFDCEGLSVVVAGDAVATHDFWRERRGYFNCVDFKLSAQTMDKMAGLADVVVPGHDNWFLV